ncbi:MULTISPECIES: hypothetical protein [Luteimonas]|uniref:hypothetical protein n=1 Tax=Luteimonas TaxID=83614 RepID=UPI000C7CF86F|nr:MULTISPECIES: hypothetical protein [Luteimonas]
MLLGACLLAAPVFAQAAEPISCELAFAADDWSPQRQAARGSGTVRCNDGRSLPVRISMKGVERVQVGEPRIRAGAGSFAGVTDPRDVIGGYAAQRGDSGPNLILRKGAVALRVTGTGAWWNQGGRPASLVISPR